MKHNTRQRQSSSQVLNNHVHCLHIQDEYHPLKKETICIYNLYYCQLGTSLNLEALTTLLLN